MSESVHSFEKISKVFLCLDTNKTKFELVAMLDKLDLWDQ